MTTEDIKKNAPIGATHYLELDFDIIYLRQTHNFGWNCFVMGKWGLFEADELDDIKPL